MAIGKYSRIDNRRSSSSYCSTVTIVVFVALCLVGIWMLTSSSVVPVQNIDVPQENKNIAKSQVVETNEANTQPFEDNPGDLPDNVRKGDDNEGSNQQESQDEKPEEKPEEKPDEQNGDKSGGNEETKPDDGSKTENGDSKEENGEPGSESKPEAGDNGSGGQGEPEENSNEKQPNSNDTEENSKDDKKADDSNDTKDGENGNRKEEENAKLNENNQSKNLTSGEVFPSGAQSELLNETSTQNGAWSTQAAESKNEKETQRSSTKQSGYEWKICNVTAGSDYIPCLDNLQAIRSLRSTKHYEHRERHCPEEPPTCLVSLPEGYKRPITWPTSREKVKKI